ncbi:MAG: thioredoxin family protein [Gemmataceae bacterium]|nr:thioredoxin family protein [Gemmataceae bacterium]
MSFRDFVNGTAGLAVVDFYRDGCPPCGAIAPIFDELAARNADVRFGKISTDEAPNVATDFKVSAVPTLIFFKQGAVVEKLVGLRKKAELQRTIDELKG